MIDECKNLLAKYQVPQRHSDFQILKFIIGKEPTINGKIWQCLREIDARYENLVNANLEYENSKDDLEIKKLQRIKLVNLKDSEIKNIKLRKIDRIIFSMERNIEKISIKVKNIEYECKTFINLLDSLVKENGFVDYNNETAQKEYFETKFSNEINLNFLTGQPINNELIKSTLCLDDNSNIKSRILGSLDMAKRKLLQNGN